MDAEYLAAYSKKGLKTRARIGFSDESAFSDKPMVRKTWAPKGITPILKVPGGWTTRSVVGLITCSPQGKRPRLYFRTMKGAVNANTFVRFLKAMKRHVRGKLILIIDNLRVHKSKTARAYYTSQPSWLTVEFLPPYAPELNPTEYLWSSGKRKHFSNASIRGGSALDRRIRRSGRKTQRDEHLLTGFLKASTLF